MITTRFYLDKRTPGKDGLCTLYLVIQKHGKAAMSSLGVKLAPDQWKDGKVVNHKNETSLNRILAIKKGDVETAVLELMFNGAFVKKTPKECLDILMEYLDPERLEDKRRREKEAASFVKYFEKYLDTIRNDGTKGLYSFTLRKVREFCDSEGYDPDTLTFDDITKMWITSFENYCLTTQKQNSASRHLRDIRAVFNSAIDDGVTTNYPFRKFKIKKEETRDKSYSAAELRALFNHKCYPGGEQEAVDIFKLMFCLIGINSVDLAYAGKPVEGRLVIGKRLDYTRKKTGKPYSIFLGKEAQEIIKKYEGKEHLLNLLERVPNYKTYFNRMAKRLRKVGLVRVSGKKSSGKALLPEICTGSARTSWATIAEEELGIPREVIAAALGHSTVDVTSTYLRTEWQQKVDDANRRVLNWVFNNKKK